MSEPATEIDVWFRKFNAGDVIALFDASWGDGLLSSYQHEGQHAGASRELVTELEQATPEEYAPLKRELENIGYAVTVIDEVEQ